MIELLVQRGERRRQCIEVAPRRTRLRTAARLAGRGVRPHPAPQRRLRRRAPGERVEARQRLGLAVGLEQLAPRVETVGAEHVHREERRSRTARRSRGWSRKRCWRVTFASGAKARMSSSRREKPAASSACPRQCCSHSSRPSSRPGAEAPVVDADKGRTQRRSRRDRHRAAHPRPSATRAIPAARVRSGPSGRDSA